SSNGESTNNNNSTTVNVNHNINEEKSADLKESVPITNSYQNQTDLNNLTATSTTSSNLMSSPQLVSKEKNSLSFADQKDTEQKTETSFVISGDDHIENNNNINNLVQDARWKRMKM